MRHSRISRLFALTAIIACAIAQSATAQKYRFGIHVDPTISWFFVDTKRFQNVGAAFGMSAGVEIENCFAERYSFASGIDYDMRGATIRYMNSGFSITTAYEGAHDVPAGTQLTVRTDMLKVPLGFKMRAIEIGYWTFFATAGLTAHYTLRQTVSAAKLGLNGESAKRMVSLVNFGYLLRLGMEYSLGGASAIVGGIGFNGGLTPVYRAGLGRITMNELHLRIGFTF